MTNGAGTPSGIPFLKGHGTENDFVLLPDLAGSLDLSPSMVAALCDRRAGLGADGVLRVVRVEAAGEAFADSSAEFFMDYRNADGSLAEMCGNGARVFARYLVEAGLEPPGSFVVATRGGDRRVDVPDEDDGDVTVAMGPATFPGPDGVHVTVEGRTLPAVAVDVGNPHAVVFVDDLADAGRLLDRPEVVPASAFPSGVNVEFVVTRGERHVAMRVHERGVGETRSCGTGACAAFSAAAACDLDVPTGAEWTVDVPGGRLRLRETPSGEVELTGPAVLLASGWVDRLWLEEHR